MFSNEVGMMRMIVGNSVTACHEAYDFRDRFFLVMELVKGRGPLTPLLTAMRGSYSEEFCKYSLYSTLKLLCELHRKNIMHRDIKSDNVLVTKDGKHQLTGLYYSKQLSQQQ